MIKVNLLNNELSAPPARQADPLENTSELLIQAVAKKSKKRLVKFLVILLVIVCSGFAAFLNRLELLDYLEQYTGPIPILEIERKGDKAKELELYLSQVKYMHSQLWKQGRDFSFLNNFNQVAFSFPKLQLASIEILDHDFLIKVLNNSRFEVTKFTKKMESVKEIDSVYSINTIPEYKDRNFKLSTEIMGQLDTRAKRDSSEKFNFKNRIASEQNIYSLLEKNRLTLTDTLSFDPKQVIIFYKYKKELKFEGGINDFMQFYLDLITESLPIEVIKIRIEIQPVERKQRARINKYMIQYNILEPVTISSN